MKATKEAMHEVAGAIIAITFCNGCCGVYSSGFMSGPVGIFYRQSHHHHGDFYCASGVVVCLNTDSGALCHDAENTHGQLQKKPTHQ